MGIKAGANFDVVAHFTDAFCEAKFGSVNAITEMQLLGDENVGDANYPINQASGFSHAHNDVLDKRHTTAGYAGDYSVNDDGQTDCSSTNAADLKFRFNLRQLGNDISTCGPGTLPDTDTNTRCTWNWNHVANAVYGSSNSADPEGFFDRSDQMVVDTWNRRRRDAVLRNTQLGGSSTVTTQNVVMTLTFRDNAGVAITPVSVTPDAGHATASGSVVTVACTGGTIPTGGNQRDAFPVCFQGDEVHVEMVYKPSDTT